MAMKRRVITRPFQRHLLVRRGAADLTDDEIQQVDAALSAGNTPVIRYHMLGLSVPPVTVPWLLSVVGVFLGIAGLLTFLTVWSSEWAGAGILSSLLTVAISAFTGMAEWRSDDWFLRAVTDEEALTMWDDVKDAMYENGKNKHPVDLIPQISQIRSDLIKLDDARCAYFGFYGGYRTVPSTVSGYWRLVARTKTSIERLRQSVEAQRIREVNDVINAPKSVPPVTDGRWTQNPVGGLANGDDLR